MSASRRRCWRYHHGCRAAAVATVVLGAHVIDVCSNPNHQPVLVPAPTQEVSNGHVR